MRPMLQVAPAGVRPAFARSSLNDETETRRTEYEHAEHPSPPADLLIAGHGATGRADGGTTLLFSHEGWRQESEFMHGCSTNWAAYLMSLKSGAEERGFNAYPGGEVSRWS